MIERRIRRLEESMGERGRCSHGVRVVWPPEDGKPPSGPEECPTCGLPRLTIRVVYEETPVSDGQVVDENRDATEPRGKHTAGGAARHGVKAQDSVVLCLRQVGLYIEQTPVVVYSLAGYIP